MKIDINCTECNKDKSEFSNGILTIETVGSKDVVYVFCSKECRTTFYEKKAGYELSNIIWKKK